MTESAIFRAEAVEFRYPGGFPGLDGVTLEIRRGEGLALLGANGSGKSTLLRLLAGLDFPSGGRVLAWGRELTPALLDDVAFGPAFRARVGVLFQNVDSQLFNATVREEVAYGPVQLGLPASEVERRVADVLRLLELEELADRPPFRLSGGEKKRVALAAVLASNPEVLLLDEPLTALDPRSQDAMIDLLRTLAATGKTLVVATHDLESARFLAGRAAVLGEDHRLVAAGPVDRVLEDEEMLVGANLVSGRRAATRARGGGSRPRDAGEPGMRGTMRVTLLGRPGCHLCEEAEALLGRLARELERRGRLLALEVRNIEEDPALHERYFLEIPVVRVEGRDVLAGRIEEEALRRLLSGEG
ncbi:MAG: ATP-binding cassette domain-containing protein [Bacillota bacterium]|nr:ATP-binding cassette domain-containing protein [Bacillota bacterium]